MSDVAMPRGWTQAEIGELCNLINGRAFKPAEWSDEGLPIIRIQNLNNPNAPFNHFAGELADKHCIHYGDLLFAWSGTPGTSFGAHVWKGGEAALNQHIFKVSFDESRIDKRFLRYAINQTLDELVAGAHGGVGLRHVTKGKFEKTRVAFPPLGEQAAIADKLDELLAQVNNLKTRLDAIPALLKRFRQSVMADAVCGKLSEDWRGGGSCYVGGFPEEWGQENFSSLGELARGKSKHRPRNDPRLFGDECPFIQTGEVANAAGIISVSDKHYSDFGLSQSRVFPQGTLCITIAANIADTALLGIDACFPDSVVGFIPDDAKCDVKFVKFLVDVHKAELKAFAPATAQKNINLKVLNSLVFPMPSFEEQKEIVRRVDQLFAFADQVEQQIQNAQARVNKLTQSILAKAFRGELTAEWRAENPELISGEHSAEALLAWIKAEKARQKPVDRRRKKRAAETAG